MLDLKFIEMEKILTYLIILMVFPISTYAQEEFAPVGAEWKYWTRNTFTYEIEHFKYESIKDTTINEKKCTIVAKFNLLGVPYVREIFHTENQKVFIYRNNQFNKLFDFGSEVGDTITVFDEEFVEFFESDSSRTASSFAYVIEQIDSIQINEIWFPRQKTKMLGQWTWAVDDIIWPIGAISSVGFLGYNSNYLTTTGGASLYCYTDSKEIEIEYSTFINCNGTITSIANSDPQKINVYSNINNQLIIEQNISNNCTLELFDLNGRLIQTNKLFSQNNTVKLSNHMTGIYLVRLIDKNTNTVIYSDKIIVKK